MATDVQIFNRCGHIYVYLSDMASLGINRNDCYRCGLGDGGRGSGTHQNVISEWVKP